MVICDSVLPNTRAPTTNNSGSTHNAPLNCSDRFSHRWRIQPPDLRGTAPTAGVCLTRFSALEAPSASSHPQDQQRSPGSSQAKLARQPKWRPQMIHRSCGRATDTDPLLSRQAGRAGGYAVLSARLTGDPHLAPGAAGIQRPLAAGGYRRDSRHNPRPRTALHRWLVNGMQGVRGSNPLSSTPGQRPSQGPTSPDPADSGSKWAANLSCKADPVVRRGRAPSVSSPGRPGPTGPPAARSCVTKDGSGRARQGRSSACGTASLGSTVRPPIDGR
jgi:hypothetical protein